MDPMCDCRSSIKYTPMPSEDTMSPLPADVPWSEDWMASRSWFSLFTRWGILRLGPPMLFSRRFLIDPWPLHVNPPSWKLHMNHWLCYAKEAQVDLWLIYISPRPKGALDDL